MKTFIEAWGSDDEPEYAVRVDQATVAQARAAVRRDFGPFDLPLRYVGIRVVNLRPDEEHKGRRHRAHIFTDIPA